MNNSEVYKYPRYYAIGYQWNTDTECDFIEACIKAYGLAGSKRILDIGCGSGRHIAALCRRGYKVFGIDKCPEMVAYVKEEAIKAGLDIEVFVDDLRSLSIKGRYDAAFCFMDTFRFLLTNEEIINHMRSVAGLLEPGGIYITDFWVPRQWDQLANEMHQWEQTADDTTVRIFYLQHPDTVDPIAQTFEDELVFEIHEAEKTQEIRGGKTRTRLIMPQEFEALIAASGVFTLSGKYGDFDLSKPFNRESLSWRMISVMKKHGDG